MIFGKTKIQKINCDTDKRIISISDIHGEVTYLDGVLKKANYSTDDILVIVGDLIEKGSESLKTVRYILGLMVKNPNVYVTMGNVDLHRLCFFWTTVRKEMKSSLAVCTGLGMFGNAGSF